MRSSVGGHLLTRRRCCYRMVRWCWPFTFFLLGCRSPRLLLILYYVKRLYWWKGLRVTYVPSHATSFWVRSKLSMRAHDPPIQKQRWARDLPSQIRMDAHDPTSRNRMNACDSTSQSRLLSPKPTRSWIPLVPRVVCLLETLGKNFQNLNGQGLCHHRVGFFRHHLPLPGLDEGYWPWVSLRCCYKATYSLETHRRNLH